MKQIKMRSIWAGAVAAVCAAGCGGGSSAGSAAGGASSTSSVGEAVFTYSGQPKPQLTSSSGSVTVVGQAGATFSSIALNPPHSLSSTYIVMGRVTDGTVSLYSMPFGTLTPQVLYHSVGGAIQPGISAYGTIAFVNGYLQAFSIRADGTGLTSLSFTGPQYVYYPQYSVDGTNRLAFTDAEGGVWVAPGTGGNATRIQTNEASSTACAWSASGADIFYSVQTSNGSDIYESPSSGGLATDVTPSALKNTGALYVLSCSADGVTILANYVPSGGTTYQLVEFSTADNADYQNITPSGDFDSEGVWSPDGSTILFDRSAVNGATPGIYEADSTGINQRLVYPDSAAGGNAVEGGIGWSPFLPKETVVAASGATFYHKAASGFLLSQTGSQFGSMVAFTATTPADAAIQAPSSGGNYTPLAFTLTADSITSIGYINGYFGTGTTLTLSSTPSAIVTIDAVTGQVDLVAPASVAKPSTAKNSDGTLTYTASFKAVYDGKGNNLAPNGAGSLTVNPKTGKLVSLR